MGENPLPWSGRTACCIAFFTFQSILLLGVSVKEALQLVGTPSEMVTAAARDIVGAKPFNDSGGWTRIKEVLVAYLHLAGIESGYSFFAPNVPRSYDLAFEVYLPGRIEYVPLSFARSEESLRWFSLMDYVGQTASDPVRQVVLKLIAHSIGQQYPTATRMRASVGTMVLPTPAEFRQGKRGSRRVLYAYDFRMDSGAPATSP
ncbi:MAG: hypothetical protein H0U88_00670 [Chthoniobacterales bacterium]|nr:hypothetical protein [Chthoniobacterales bacterium]